MKTTKRNFLKELLSAIPLSKIIDVEGSENKELAKKEQENIDKFYTKNDFQCGISGCYVFSGSLY